MLTLKGRRGDSDDELFHDSNFDKLLVTKYGRTEAQIHDDYLQKLNYLLQNIVDRFPGILHRKMIVFPINQNNAHWVATFVFHASSLIDIIEENVENLTSKVDSKAPRACFFRYCPLHPDGQKTVGLDTGIKWFLNLCASYDVHLKKEEDDHPMSWIEPFGSEVEGNFLCTRAFPALYLDAAKKAILPSKTMDTTVALAFVPLLVF